VSRLPLARAPSVLGLRPARRRPSPPQRKYSTPSPRMTRLSIWRSLLSTLYVDSVTRARRSLLLVPTAALFFFPMSLPSPFPCPSLFSYHIPGARDPPVSRVETVSRFLPSWFPSDSWKCPVWSPQAGLGQAAATYESFSLPFSPCATPLPCPPRSPSPCCFLASNSP